MFMHPEKGYIECRFTICFISISNSKMDDDTSINLNNITMESTAMDSLYPYLLFTKILLLLWDAIGLIVNGLGIDLMWHGIEINHAVYSLVLQDIVLCWLSSFLWLIMNWIWWSSTGINYPEIDFYAPTIDFNIQ